MTDPTGCQRVLVTGAAGFLGSHLCEYLLSKGNSVCGVDNLSSGDVANLENCLVNEKFEFHEHDVLQPINFEFDQVFHLASPASPIKYQENPINTAKVIFNGTLNVLEAAHACGARVLLASTSEAYGDPHEHPQTENYWGNVNPTGPRACYDESKRAAETLAYDFNRMYGLNVRVARIFNTYGPRMQANDGRVISNFVNQALEGKDLTIYGNGRQTRSFCYYSDLVDGLTRLMAFDKTPCLVNLGNPQEIDIASVAQQILTLTNAKGRLIFKDLPEDDPKRRCPDIALAQKMLKWTPRVSLDAGLRETISYFQATENRLLYA